MFRPIQSSVYSFPLQVAQTVPTIVVALMSKDIEFIYSKGSPVLAMDVLEPPGFWHPTTPGVSVETLRALNLHR